MSDNFLAGSTTGSVPANPGPIRGRFHIDLRKSPATSKLPTDATGKSRLLRTTTHISATRNTPVARVFLVHGVQTPALGLQPLVTALKSRFASTHFVLVDLWGHGLTDTPVAAHESALFHALIEAVMARLGWDNAHFIGYSFGGATVTSFAAKYPARVSSLVLIAPAGLIKSASFDETQRGYLAGGEGLEERASAWIFEYLEGGKLVVPSDWRERVAQGEVVAEAVREWELREHAGHRASVVGIFRDGGVLDQHAAFAEVAKKDIRCLSILGELDTVCSEQDLRGVGMEDIAIVPRVGHAVARQRVPEVAQLIESFWNKL
ncbi:hypothetical protein N7468_006268 [Penicillium chermesinum]|uniref:AB hydrolase-1 domain-containing protein n=1 Tax=Penicillium chermesinum TaxID=63820 RepID=A0A9W9NSE3_9EURO|nr:uncharacterized protein N7468_006268 [Penicillium chermesinum]KAJ5225043.1 hypothetical protein N7468_006268 [Penicillium chermesinum]